MPRKKAGPKAASTRRDIQTAALRLFYEKGYAATGIREIASEVGVQVATLYNHFSSKQELLVETLIEGGIEQNKELQQALDAAGDDPRDRLKALIRNKIFEQEKPITGRVFDSELRSLEPENRKRVVALRDSQDRALSEILEDGFARGYWDKPNKITRFLVFQSMYITIWYRPNGPLSLDEIADHCFDFVARALGGKDIDRWGESAAQVQRKKSEKKTASPTRRTVA